MTKEQLQFFMDEVLTLFDYGEEEAERGVDPLDFVRGKVKEEREFAKAQRRAGINHAIDRLRQATSPHSTCTLCFGYKYLLYDDGLMHPCPACNGTGKSDRIKDE